jgi:hypothetical protein
VLTVIQCIPASIWHKQINTFSEFSLLFNECFSVIVACDSAEVQDVNTGKMKSFMAKNISTRDKGE